MKKLSILMIMFVSMFTSTNLLAWGFKGHVLVAQIAYENLSPNKKEEVNSLSTIIYDHLSEKQKTRLDRNYSGVSTFAKISVLPDTWRRWKLKTIFSHFGAPVPNSLKSLEFKRTGSWHFINQPYPNQSCHTIKPKNVIWGLDKVQYAFNHETNKNAKSVLLVMLTHWIGDVNQPLHTISHVDGQCVGDKGGNLYCLSNNNSGYCRKNLHHLWDYAVGYLNGRKNLLKEAYRLQKRFPKDSIPISMIASNPNQWIKTTYQYAQFIYSTEPHKMPEPGYYRKGQKLAQRQIVLAGYRLSYILNK